MLDRLNPTQTAAALINRHGELAETYAAEARAEARARGEAGSAAQWDDVVAAVRALMAIAPMATVHANQAEPPLIVYSWRHARAGRPASA